MFFPVILILVSIALALGKITWFLGGTKRGGGGLGSFAPTEYKAGDYRKLMSVNSLKEVGGGES